MPVARGLLLTSTVEQSPPGGFAVARARRGLEVEHPAGAPLALEAGAAARGSRGVRVGLQVAPMMAREVEVSVDSASRIDTMHWTPEERAAARAYQLARRAIAVVDDPAAVGRMWGTRFRAREVRANAAVARRAWRAATVAPLDVGHPCHELAAVVDARARWTQARATVRRSRTAATRAVAVEAARAAWVAYQAVRLAARADRERPEALALVLTRWPSRFGSPTDRELASLARVRLSVARAWLASRVSKTA